MSFNVGDKVKCIDAEYPLETGEIYTVESGFNDEFITVKGVSGNWYCSRFELVEEYKPVVTNTVSTNPKAALGAASLPLSMLSPITVAYGCLGKYNGKLKYGGSNYIGTEVVLSIYIDALKRHISRFELGEEIDPADGVPHFSAMLANIDIILSARAAGTLIDDRLRSDGQLAALDALKPVVAHLQELHKSKNPKHYYLSEVNNVPKQD